MEIFTLLGLIIFLFAIIAILTVIFNIPFDEPFGAPGVIFVMVILSITLSSFFLHPEKFGYEKIVSNNSVEQEVEE